MSAKLDRLFISYSLLWLLVVIMLAIYGITTGDQQYVSFAPVATNSFAALALMGLLYRGYTTMKQDSLALPQFWTTVGGITCLLLLNFFGRIIGFPAWRYWVAMAAMYVTALGVILIIIIFLRAKER